MESTLAKFNVENCSPSSSPKVSQKGEPGDREEVDEETGALLRSAVLTLFYAASDRTDAQSSVRCLRTRLKAPTKGDARRLEKLTRRVQGTQRVAVLFSNSPAEEKVLRVSSDSDWATDTKTRESASGSVIMAGGCRAHALSRELDVIAFSICEA